MERFTHPDLAVIEGEDGTTISALPMALKAWARRPGNEWPCSALARSGSVLITFDHKGDLVGLEGEDEDLVSDELNAFVEDVCGSAHPTRTS